jgi:hypothetical protein
VLFLQINDFDMPMTTETLKTNDTEKKLYDYQLKDLNRIFDVMAEEPDDFNLLYQLPQVEERL